MSNVNSNTNHESLPSFYAVIPAHVRYNRQIEDGAKLFYGEITALCSHKGYCWATNQYFADLYGCSISTIHRWLRSLKECNLIEIDTVKEGIHWNRRIWVSPEIKKQITKMQKQQGGVSKITGGGVENNTHINTPSITESKEAKASSPPTPSKGESGGVVSLLTLGKFVKITQDELDTLTQAHGESLVNDLIEQINDYLASTGKKPYKDYAAAIRQWIRRREEKSTVKSTPSPSKGRENRELHKSGNKQSKINDPRWDPVLQKIIR